MRLTEQQRAELERRGWTVEASLDQPPVEWLLTKYGRGVRVTASGLLGTLYGLGMPFLEEAAEVCAVLGIAPPGYRLVPEEVAQEWLAAKAEAAEPRPLYEVWQEFTGMAPGKNTGLRLRKAEEALAAALGGSFPLTRRERRLARLQQNGGEGR